MKLMRQARLLQIVGERTIRTQDELARQLKAEGFEVRQGTVSRDVKQLGIVKISEPDGRYRYAPPGEDNPDVSGRLNTIFREGVISAQSAQNIVVLKTLPGLASAACSALDAMRRPAVVGTLAGDDTALVVMSESHTADALAAEIQAQLRMK